MNITITKKQAEDMITLLDKNTDISRRVIKGFLQSRLDEKPVNRVHREDWEMMQKIDWPNSDLQ